jgi:Spy/CpxP family protein refolding chaperone
MIGLLMVDAPELGLKPEQKTAVDAIKADLAKAEDAPKAEKDQLKADITAGVAAGKLDKAKLDADTKKLVQTSASTAAAIQDAVNKLHKTLDAEQRKKLVEHLRKQAEAMKEHMGGHGPGPHESGKAEGHEHAKDHPGPGGMGMMGPHEGMQKLEEQLGLSAEQKEKLKTKLQAAMKAEMDARKQHQEAMHKRMTAIADAFAGDKFDAKKAGVAEHMGDMVKMMTKNRIQFVEAVLSVLTPEQRTKFAEHVKQHSEPGED